MLRIVIEDGEGAQHAVPLIRDEITIGRKDGNTIRLTERNVSRKHARLVKTGDEKSPTILVEDLDSYNGIKLNGERISGQCTMRPTDLLQIGDYFLELQTEKQRKRAASIPATEPDAAPKDLANDALEEANTGRLVVVSSNLAGQEYSLQRREVIIGRTTAENDLVLNHRSISRHHAKFIFRDGAFTILDLGSANGVKVNGEAFGTTTLVSGDILELGHVKLRYCAPGDEYVFTQKDIEDVDISGGPSVAQLVLIALVLVAVGAGAFFLVDQLAGDGGPASSETAGEDPRGATAVPPTTVPPVTLDIGKLLTEGQGYLAKRQWSEAKGVFDRILQTASDHPGALAGRKTAVDEMRNQKIFQELGGHVAESRWEEALWRFGEMNTASVYYVDAAKLHVKAQQGQAGVKLALGRRHLSEQNMNGARAVQAELAGLGYASVQAQLLDTEIASAVASAQAAAKAPDANAQVNQPPKATTSTDTASDPVDPPPKTVVEVAARDEEIKPVVKPVKKPPAKRRLSYDALCKKALKKMWSGDATGGHRLYERAIKLNPRRIEAYKKMCVSLKNSGSEKAYKYCREWYRRETNPINRKTAKNNMEKAKAKLE